MWKHLLLISALLAQLSLSRVQPIAATCHGHRCDEEHEKAVQAGLLGQSRSVGASSGDGVVRPKECKGAKLYPKDKLRPQVGPSRRHLPHSSTNCCQRVCKRFF